MIPIFFAVLIIRMAISPLLAISIDFGSISVILKWNITVLTWRFVGVLIS